MFISSWVRIQDDETLIEHQESQKYTNHAFCDANNACARRILTELTNNSRCVKKHFS